MNQKKILVLLVVLTGVAVATAAGIMYYKKSIETEYSDISGSQLGLEDEVIPPQSTEPTEIAVGTETENNETTNDKNPARKGIKDVKWEDLYKLDYKTGKAPKEIKDLHNTKVRIPGFIVPLSDDLTMLKEFLLVPNAQACIHVPAPPPNLIVFVELKKPMPIEDVFNPSWAYGTLLIETTESEYGAAAYRMKADSLEEYKF